MAERPAPWSRKQPGWHLADWGWWGRAETALKLVAIGIALIAAAEDGAWSIPSKHRLPFTALTVIAVGYLGTVIDRYLDREVLAMAFVIAVVAGHWAMVFAMGDATWPSGWVKGFAGLMFVGDLVKLGYFLITGTRVRQLPRLVPIIMTGTLASAYLTAFMTA